MATAFLCLLWEGHPICKVYGVKTTMRESCKLMEMGFMGLSDPELQTILNGARACMLADSIQTKRGDLVSSAALGKHFLKL